MAATASFVNDQTIRFEGHTAEAAFVRGSLSPASSTQELKWTQKSMGKGAASAVVVDPSGNPHVVFNKELKTEIALIHAWHDGKRWRSEVIDTNAYSSAIAIDRNGGIHVAYHAWNVTGPVFGYHLKYAYYNGSSWATELIEPGGDSASIAIDQDGIPHIVHVTSGDHTIRHVTKVGSEWVKEDVSSYMSGGTSIVMHDGHIYVVFTSDDGVNLATNESGAWLTSTIDNGREGSAAFDGNGNLHVVYMGVGEGNGELRHAWYTGGSWQKEPLVTQHSLFGEEIPTDVTVSSLYPVIITDDYGRIHMAFGLVAAMSKGYTELLGYALFQNGSWSYGDVIAPPMSGIDNSIAVSSTGIVHVSTTKFVSGNPTILSVSLKGTKLSLSTSPRENGTVRLSMPDKSCSSRCVESYAPGTSVTLTAVPVEGKDFLGWKGACTGTNLTCTVTMDRARNVSARFSK
jgi:hypothetical protein